MSHLFVQGNSLHALEAFEDHSFDACVTDPPYELGFMGKHWDKSGISYNPDLWRQVLRVLKPGAHLLAFGGTRTYHRMACAIEDAGFEIRDQIQWLYGSGFPKSLDVSKAIDKRLGAERQVVGQNANGSGAQPSKLSNHGEGDTGIGYMDGSGKVFDITAAASDEAKQWNGWGTALKPANEPICLARKPIEKGLSVAQNVLKWGTGAINIDACRIDTSETLSIGSNNRANAVVNFGMRDNRGRDGEASADRRYDKHGATNFAATPGPRGGDSNGRWPANVIHDSSDEVLEHFPATASGQPSGIKVGGQKNAYGHFEGGIAVTGFGDEGSAARFFYCAKASQSERNRNLHDLPAKAIGHNRFDKCADCGGTILQNPTRPSACKCESPNRANNAVKGNHHPTVKPVELMKYLCRLITPPNGRILDPFCGSGSTVIAALIERFQCVGIDIDAEYLQMANLRINELQVSLI